MIQSSDGAFLVAGTIIDPDLEDTDIWLLKTNEKGDMEWSQPYVTPNSEYCTSMIQTKYSQIYYDTRQQYSLIQYTIVSRSVTIAGLYKI